MKPLKILYICTTFPKLSEQFIQREVDALMDQDVDMEIVTLWGGQRIYQGVVIRTFPKYKLLKLLWTLPAALLMRPGIILKRFWDFFKGRPPSFINFVETLLGYSFAVTHWMNVRRNPPDLIHGTWATCPSSASWLLSELTGVPFTMAAHAYDVFEHGGDWHIVDKLRKANFVHTTSQNTGNGLLAFLDDPKKLLVIRSGLNHFPELDPMRKPRNPIRLVYIGRLVEKKGLFYQLDILKALKDSGVPFQARIVGSGELDAELRDYHAKLGLMNDVDFWGQVTFESVQEQLDWADVFLFTGIISKKGDRDGLPNVLGESMAHGVVVLTTEVGATTEAIRHNETGFVLPIDNRKAWIEKITLLGNDDAEYERVRNNARNWVEENFCAKKNSEELFLAFRKVVDETSNVR